MSATPAVSGGNKKLESVVRTNGSNRHNLTYGEVRRPMPGRQDSLLRPVRGWNFRLFVCCCHHSPAPWPSQILPSSFAADVIPLLGPMTTEDVVIDLGSGTGKLCVQLALETGAGLVRGIEFASRRCDVADEALRRMSAVGSAALGSAMAKGPVAASLFGSDWEDVDTGGVPEEPAQAPPVAAAPAAQVPLHLEPVVRAAATRLSLERGCFIAADLTNVTVAFVNNTVFEPDLMNVSEAPRPAALCNGGARRVGGGVVRAMRDHSACMGVAATPQLLQWASSWSKGGP